MEKKIYESIKSVVVDVDEEAQVDAIVARVMDILGERMTPDQKRARERSRPGADRPGMGGQRTGGGHADTGSGEHEQGSKAYHAGQQKKKVRGAKSASSTDQETLKDKLKDRRKEAAKRKIDQIRKVRDSEIS